MFFRRKPKLKNDLETKESAKTSVENNVSQTYVKEDAEVTDFNGYTKSEKSPKQSPDGENESFDIGGEKGEIKDSEESETRDADLNDDDEKPNTPPPIYETAKLFGVSEEKLTGEFNAYKAGKLFRRVNLLAIDVRMSVELLNGLIKNAIDLGLESVTVLPSKIIEAKKFAGDKIKVRVALFYPFGAETLKFKQKAISNAVKRKVSAIELPLEISDLAQKKPQLIVKEWKKLKRKAGKVPLILTVDFDLLTIEEITLVTDIVKRAGIEKVKTSTCVLNCGSNDFQTGGNLPCLETVKYEVATLRPTSSDILSMFRWGAETVSSPNVIDALMGVKKLLGCD